MNCEHSEDRMSGCSFYVLIFHKKLRRGMRKNILLRGKTYGIWIRSLHLWTGFQETKAAIKNNWNGSRKIWDAVYRVIYVAPEGRGLSTRRRKKWQNPLYNKNNKFNR